MDNACSTLIIGLAGIIATVITSGLGFYFTAKARASPLREMLYSKQIDLISKIIYTQGRFRLFATILSRRDTEYKDKARDDLGKSLKDYSKFIDEATAILPTELWVEARKLNSAMANLIGIYDETKSISEENFKELLAIDVKVALVARAVLGIDELSKESLNLFTSKKEFDKLTRIEFKEHDIFAKAKINKS